MPESRTSGTLDTVVLSTYVAVSPPSEITLICVSPPSAYPGTIATVWPSYDFTTSISGKATVPYGSSTSYSNLPPSKPPTGLPPMLISSRRFGLSTGFTEKRIRYSLRLPSSAVTSIVDTSPTGAAVYVTRCSLIALMSSAKAKSHVTTGATSVPAGSSTS